MQNPTFTKSEFREEYEVKDSTGKLRGFIWRFKDHWAIRIDNNVASYQNTLPAAKENAVNQINDSYLLDEHGNSGLWDEHGNSGMRHMENCDISGGETDCNPIKTIKL